MNMAASGRPCMNWTNVENYTITASLTIDDISKAKNYCRRVPFTAWNGPSCVTVDEARMVRLERCDVRYCGTTFYACLCHNVFLCIQAEKSVCNLFLTAKILAKIRQTSITALISKLENVAIANTLQLEAGRRHAVPICLNFVTRAKFELAQPIRYRLRALFLLTRYVTLRP